MLRRTKVENGWVRGLPAADPRITSFKGIPFAAPPVGQNRWRAPQPADDWQGERTAYEFAPVSMQAKTVIDDRNIYTREWAVDPDIPMAEDCLYLNIWTPANTVGERLPVFVWYFGGGLQVGHTAEMEFDGERIARRGIVVVTANYRLNVFGFLCHPEITADAPSAPANFGHLDQQAATRWVQRNIAAFGGDPANITIGGQSAGGGSVLSQLTSPQNQGLFQKAIIESGIIAPLYPGNPLPVAKCTLAQAEHQGEDFFTFLGVRTLEEARALDAATLRDKMLEYKQFWGTVVDGQFCVGNSFDLLVQNRHWNVPLMMGLTSSEFPSIPKARSMAEFRAMAAERFGERANEFLSICHAEKDDLNESIQRATTRGIEYAIRVAARSLCQNGNAPLYYYLFDADIPGWDHPGTFHSVDLWFFFETLAKCWRPFVGKHYDLARKMCSYWANFIRTGNPNGPDSTGDDLPHWEAYTPAEPFGMVFADDAEFVRKQPGELMQFLVEEFPCMQSGR